MYFKTKKLKKSFRKTLFSIKKNVEKLSLSLEDGISCRGNFSRISFVKYFAKEF